MTGIASTQYTQSCDYINYIVNITQSRPKQANRLNRSHLQLPQLLPSIPSSWLLNAALRAHCTTTKWMSILLKCFAFEYFKVASYSSYRTRHGKIHAKLKVLKEHGLHVDKKMISISYIEKGFLKTQQY